MFAPPLYLVRKFPFSLLSANSFRLELKEEEDRRFRVRQQDNLLFRQIRRLTHTNSGFNPYIVFVDTKGASQQKEPLNRLLISGFTLNGTQMCIRDRV